MATSDTFNLDDLEGMISEIQMGQKHKNPFGMNALCNPMSFMGLPIFEEPPPPQKVKLSESVQVTKEFRKDFDTWLAGFFGYREGLLGRDQVIISNFGMVVRKDTLSALMSTVTA